MMFDKISTEELLNHAIRSKSGDTNSMLSLIEMFNPLIMKYVHLLNNSDDAKQELILSFIETVYHFPVENCYKQNSQYLFLSYIKETIKNKYIFLSKQKNKRLVEDELDDDIIPEKQDELHLSDKIFIKDCLNQLTSQQFKVIKLRYYYGYSDIEISKILNISRQSINRIKIRASIKLKKLMA